MNYLGTLFIFLSMNTSLVSFGASEYEWKAVENSTSISGVSVTGRVVPQDGALNIESARVQGRVLAILKREGEKIVLGTPLYSISSAECFSLLEERRVAVSKKIDELIQGVAKREKQLGLKIEDNQCVVIAGHAGILTKRNLESGASFNVGDILATTLDLRRLMVEFDIPERDQAQVQEGQKVSFQFASNPGMTYIGAVQNVVPTIDPVTRTSKARLTPKEMPKNISLDALVFGEVDIGRNDAILKVPTSSLVFYHNQQFVIAGGEKTPTPVAIQVISESENKSAIRPQKEGALNAGDLVVTKGAQFLFKKLKGDSLI